jgi:hypothetical protein
MLDEPEPEPEPEPEQLGGGSSCQLPDRLLVETCHSFDTTQFDFTQAVTSLFKPEFGDNLGADGMAPTGATPLPLGEIHSSPRVQRWLEGMLRNESRPYAMRRNVVDCAFKKARPWGVGGALQELYLRFLRQEVMPIVVEGMGGPGATKGMLYQREPNFRCHLPGTGQLLVHKHCDADYWHGPNEVNFWLPLTRTFGTNTGAAVRSVVCIRAWTKPSLPERLPTITHAVWSESCPGLGDFHPFELTQGQMMQFFGNRCAHYTVPNDTAATRVSIDFRVIPMEYAGWTL